MIVNVKQGSEEWHALRYGRLTATRLANILGFGYDTPLRTWEQMTGLRPEQSSSVAMSHGSDNETFAADEFAFRMGETLAETGTVIHDRKPFLSASPDRLVGSRAILEIKCPYRNGIPDVVNPGYLAQVILQLACLDDRDTAYLMHYVAPGAPVTRGGGPAGQGGAGIVHLVRRDEAVERLVLEAAGAWYADHIVRGLMPEKGRRFPVEEAVLRSVLGEEVLRWET